MKNGIELITEERNEQIEKHGFTKKHDIDYHDDGELSWNAAVLASPNVLYYPRKYANSHSFEKAKTSEDWMLPGLNYKGNVIIDNEGLSNKDRVKQLIIAGALIAAEIDRLQADNS